MPLLSDETALVVTVNVALVAPAGITTVAGVLAPTVVVTSETVAPEAGAEPVSATLPLAV